MDEAEENYSILLETDQDYREALAALEEQLVYGEELMISIVRLVDCIHNYEVENNIEVEVDEEPASI